jgi:hypothetical protein
MTDVTVFGAVADPEELRGLAQAVSERESGWRERVDALPAYVLTPETLAGEPDVIAEHLIDVARFLERWRDGTAFTYPELAGQVAAIRERAKGNPPLTFGGRRRRP